MEKIPAHTNLSYFCFFASLDQTRGKLNDQVLVDPVNPD